MSDSIKEYRGADIVVRYDVKRCIHAAECVRGLPQVFDPSAHPWVNPDAAQAEAVAEVVSRCPTGALHADWQGRPAKLAIANRATLCADGPIYLRGEVEVADSAGNVTLRDERLALCRCGASKNKPLCDGSHTKEGFHDAGTLPPQPGSDTPAAPGVLTVTALADGPLQVSGPLQLFGSDDKSGYSGEKCFLCRCGGSKNKPFCDGSHKALGFKG